MLRQPLETGLQAKESEKERFLALARRFKECSDPAEGSFKICGEGRFPKTFLLSLRQGGARLTFGSDWPGTNASYYPINPLLGLFAAETRQTLEGQPAGGWFPDQRFTLEEAMHAFTVENGWSTFEENAKGAIREGLLADLAVPDRDVFARPARELREARVLYRIVGGRIVHEPARSAAGQ